MRSLTILLLLTTAIGLSAADAPDISHDELMKAIEAKSVVLVDCNGTKSFEDAHIPGAIDFQSSKEDLVSKLPEDKSTLVVAYCGGPGCGAWKKGAKVVADAGYTNVRHYSAGLKGWKEAQDKMKQN